MKKFKFTLAAVHDVREMKQEKEQLIFGEKQREVVKAEERIAEIERMQISAMENYARRMSAGASLDPFELQLNSNHLASLDKLKCDARKFLELKQKDFQLQTETLAAATREVKVTGRLRETQQMRYRLESDRSEQNALDELVSANFARRLSQTK